MQGRISAIAAGLALAFGGGVAGAALISNGAGGEARPPVAELASDRSAAESQQVALANVLHALKTAQKARRIARRARNKANESLATTTALLDDVDKALADSASALAAAQEAEADAATALQAANSANSRIDTTEMVSATAPGQVEASSETEYVALAGGPQVTVTVPASGLIEVYASSTFGEDGNMAVAADGAIALFEDGQQVPISQEALGICASPPLDGPLLSAGGLDTGDETTLATPAALNPFGCGVAGAVPSPILLERAPGQHTYELRYADAGCGCASEPAAFSNRTLRVAPRL